MEDKRNNTKKKGCSVATFPANKVSLKVKKKVKTKKKFVDIIMDLIKREGVESTRQIDYI